jgi:hypothetical protein
MDSQSAWAFLKLLKTMYTKATGNRTKQLDFVSSVNQTAPKSRAGKALKFGLMEATILATLVMGLSKVWEFIFGQMARDTRVTGSLTKCVGEEPLNGRMGATLEASSRVVLCMEMVFTLGKTVADTTATTV